MKLWKDNYQVQGSRKLWKDALDERLLARPANRSYGSAVDPVTVGP